MRFGFRPELAFGFAGILTGCDQAGSTTLSNTANAVEVSISGKSAAVAFAGLAPGFVGLYQVNAVVPSGVATGIAQVTLMVAGQSSPPASLTVQ